MATIDYKALAERLRKLQAGEAYEAATLIERMAQEKPAMWVQSNHLDEAKRNVFMARLAPRQVHPDYVPLYTHPAPNEPQAEPKREPLSDWRIGELHRQWLANPETVTIADLMRAVERAHGIGGSDAE